MRTAVGMALLWGAAMAGAQESAGTTNAVSTNVASALVTRVDPLKLEIATRALRDRQERISRKAVSYLWDQRMDPDTGKIGKVQMRYLQALCYLALAADGSIEDPRYGDRRRKVIESLKQPILELEGREAGDSKVFVGTSRETLAFETHAVVALAYEQLAASRLGNPGDNELFTRGAESAIDYVMDFRRRGRNYDRAGGWPVNAAPYNQTRPDRRCTLWQLLLMKSRYYAGGKVDSSAMEEGPGFILAAQRLPPEVTPSIREAEKTHREWLPRLKRGELVPEAVRDTLNDYYEYKRQVEEVGGFGIDTIGIISPGATAVGLYAMGLFPVAEAERCHLAMHAYSRMPLAWDTQRFFLNQFFGARGMWMYSLRFRTLDYCNYMNRLLTLMEQKQDADGSFPLGSLGVEELNQMERVYTTAMCVLIVNANRGNLVFDRPPY